MTPKRKPRTAPRPSRRTETPTHTPPEPASVTRQNWIALLQTHLEADLGDGETLHNQRAKLLLDRIDLADGLGLADLGDLQEALTAIQRIGTRAHQRTARG